MIGSSSFCRIAHPYRPWSQYNCRRFDRAGRADPSVHAPSNRPPLDRLRDASPSVARRADRLL